eukprot:scaffold1698_cov279-Chaetoceros_neogracile.AAC.18
MSRLNALIKLVVFMGNTLFLLLSLIVIIVASLITSDKFAAFNILRSFKRVAVFTLVLGVAALIVTIYGCCGSLNQTVRKGCMAGRRALCVHQVYIIVILIASIIQANELERKAESFLVVLENEDQFVSYDAFEAKLDKHFNTIYFENMCTMNDDSTTNVRQDRFFVDWIDENCPSKMGTENCSNGCEFPCPDQRLCIGQGLTDYCAYHQCRSETLHEVENLLRPTITFLRIMSLFCLIMIVATCLLICYNPRDDIEVELLKTGVMTEEDVNMIRKLKSSSGRNFSYQKGTRTSINLDTLHEEVDRSSDVNKRANGSAFGNTFKRANGGRVYPI